MVVIVRSGGRTLLDPWLVVAPVGRLHDLTCDNHDWSCDKSWDQSWRSCDWSCDWPYMTDDFSCISSQDRWYWSYVGLSQCDRLRGRRSNTPLVLRPPHSALVVRSQGHTIWCDWGFNQDTMRRPVITFCDSFSPMQSLGHGKNIRTFVLQKMWMFIIKLFVMFSEMILAENNSCSEWSVYLY